MSETPINLVQLRLANNKAANQLLRKGGSSNAIQNDLSQIAAQRSEDTINFTQTMLKTRVARDLDETLALQMEKNPEIRNDFYIGVILNENFSVEVVKKSDAFESLPGLKDAEAQVESMPMGYYQRREFPLETPNEPAYRELQNALNMYFSRNEDVLQYLRNSPPPPAPKEDLYKTI
jgi:hypothetical protein